MEKLEFFQVCKLLYVSRAYLLLFAFQSTEYIYFRMIIQGTGCLCVHSTTRYITCTQISKIIGNIVVEINDDKIT